MLSHALYPALDAERIASQSPAIVTGLLRGELGFEGVIVTDSIEAQAVLDRQGWPRAAERSMRRRRGPDPHDRHRELEPGLPAAAARAGARRPSLPRRGSARVGCARARAEGVRWRYSAERARARAPSARGAPSGCRRSGAPTSRPGRAPRRTCRRRSSARACPRARRAAPGPRPARAAPRACRGCAASGRPSRSSSARSSPRWKP